MNEGHSDKQGNGDPELAPARDACKDHQGKKGDLLIVLQKIQAVYGYVPRETLPVVAEALGAGTSEIYGVLTFYNRFHLSRQGRHTIRACRGTACHFKGSGEIIEMIRRRYELQEGRNTTADGEFSIEEVACLGACGIAPVMAVDEDTYGNLTPLDALSAIRKYAPPDSPDLPDMPGLPGLQSPPEATDRADRKSGERTDCNTGDKPEGEHP